MRTKCIIFGKAIKIRNQNYKQNLPENYSKSTKMTITVCKFSKIFRGSNGVFVSFLFLLLKLLKWLKIYSAEKTMLEKVTKFNALPKKISEYVPDMKHFKKADLRPFPGLNVFVFS